MGMLYRAVFTRCNNGKNFFGKTDSTEELKIFATSGKMDIDDFALFAKDASTALQMYPYKRDFEPGKEYLPEVYRCFKIGTTSIILCWRMMAATETGSRDFFISKAIMGSFERHPMEFLNGSFLEGKGDSFGDFFMDYPDAQGNTINEFKQLLTFKGNVYPPNFQAIKQDAFFSMLEKNGQVLINFDSVRNFVKQDIHVGERIRAAVHHLIQQMSIPEERRKSIILSGTIPGEQGLSQIRHLAAAIGYAFPIFAAPSVSVAFNTPVDFNYSFKFAALIGFNLADDPYATKEKLAAMRDAVLLENLPSAPSSNYYNCITQYDDTHKDFIFNFLRESSSENIADTPMLYDDYIAFCEFFERLRKFLDDRSLVMGLPEFLSKLNRYVSAGIFIPGFYSVSLEAIKKVELNKFDDVFTLLDIFSLIESMISNTVAMEYDDTVENIQNEFNEIYTQSLFDLFRGILTETLPFSNTLACNPQKLFDRIVSKNSQIALSVAQLLADERNVEDYTFFFKPISSNLGEVTNYERKVIYHRLMFFKYLMEWLGLKLTEVSARYFCKAFNSALIQVWHASSIASRISPYVSGTRGTIGMTMPGSFNFYPPSVDLDHLPGQYNGTLKNEDRKDLYANIFNPKTNNGYSVNESDNRGLHIFTMCQYEPKNINEKIFFKAMHEVFAWKFPNEIHAIDASKKKLDLRIIDTLGVFDKYSKNGISNNTLMNFFLEDVSLEDEQYVFYYKYASKYFRPPLPEILYGGFLNIALDGLFRTKRYTDKDERYLKLSSDLVKKLENSKHIDEILATLDYILDSVFKMENWEGVVTSEKHFVKPLAAHLYSISLPSSSRVVFYNILHEYTLKKNLEEADTIISEFDAETNESLRKCNASYKRALLRVLEEKRWTGTFFVQLLKIFEYDEVFSKNILSVISKSVSARKTNAFGDFCYYLHHEERTKRIVSILHLTKNFYLDMKFRSAGKDRHATKFVKELTQYAQNSKEVTSLIRWFEKPESQGGSPKNKINPNQKGAEACQEETNKH